MRDFFLKHNSEGKALLHRGSESGDVKCVDSLASKSNGVQQEEKNHILEFISFGFFFLFLY